MQGEVAVKSVEYEKVSSLVEILRFYKRPALDMYNSANA